MYPFRNILFPTDFSQNSRAALKYAAAFARNVNGRVVVFNVQASKVPADLLNLPEDAFAQQTTQWLSQVRSETRTLLSDPLLENLEVEAAFAVGEPSTEIGRAAIDHEIDLVTVVTRGRKRLSRAFGGSIAEEIVAESPCAVLAIRPPQRDFVELRQGQTHLHLKRILVATNFRPSSVAATLLATHMSNHMGAELHAVYVIGDYFEQISAMFPEGGLAALTRLRSYVEERMAHLARTDGSRASTHVAEGRPYEEIVRLAAKTEADLIVIGTAVHNSLFGGTPVLGSEIERVIRNAPCPVLCVPAARVVTPLPSFVTQAVPT
ncbi:MAG TPA: universal stress protein [Pyrinomonadaceae bacterium]|jgi:nucleotide-binding universal stress UspA family protein|nr:universal stress protein [Pyrinomonadaceae bacterium]